jgi:hypothetical protein
MDFLKPFSQFTLLDFIVGIPVALVVCWILGSLTLGGLMSSYLGWLTGAYIGYLINQPNGSE